MDIQVRADTAEVSRFLRTLFRDQLPFATSVAINNTALDFQATERHHMGEAFTIRRRKFMERSVKLKPFSTKRSLEARITLDSPGARSDIFAKFEEGGIKRPRSGTRLAVPEQARRTKRGVISRTQRPKAFNFTLWGSGPEATVFRGARKTFLIQRPDGTGGIYQRKGRKGAGRRMASSIATRQVHDVNVRTLYRFTPQARIDSRLAFEEIGENVVEAAFADNFEEAFRRAIGAGRTTNVGRHRGKVIIKASASARRIGRTDVLR